MRIHSSSGVHVHNNHVDPDCSCRYGTAHTAGCSGHAEEHCSNCTLGYYLRRSDAGPPYPHSARATHDNRICQICPAGHHCDGLTKTPCPAGHRQRLEGKHTCDKCGNDRMYAAEGSTECKMCTRPLHTSGGTPITRHKCERCPAGFEGNGGSQCYPIDPNDNTTVCDCGFRYTDGLQQDCTKCRAGRYSPCGDSLHTCLLCAAGRFSAAGSWECQACPVGRASSEEASSCHVCGEGRFAADKGEDSPCDTCPGGKHGVPSRDRCLGCPKAAPVDASLAREEDAAAAGAGSDAGAGWAVSVASTCFSTSCVCSCCCPCAWTCMPLPADSCVDMCVAGAPPPPRAGCIPIPP